MKLRAVVLDWAGTTVDHGCMAPVGVFVEVFRRHGVDVDVARAREPMGVHKREHIRLICEMPEVARAWRRVHGSPPDVVALYAEAIPLQIEVLPRYADPIPGAVEAVERMRARGLKIGSTTGYDREMLDVLERASAARGYRPDVAIAASEVPEGRPAPYLCWEAAMRLGAWPAAACVKVGDTPVDIEAGLNAGFWTVGVALTGNEIGVPADCMDKVHAWRREQARQRLRDAGAHHVIDSLAQIDGVLDRIERSGGRP